MPPVLCDRPAGATGPQGPPGASGPFTWTNSEMYDYVNPDARETVTDVARFTPPTDITITRIQAPTAGFVRAIISTDPLTEQTTYGQCEFPASYHITLGGPNNACCGNPTILASGNNGQDSGPVDTGPISFHLSAGTEVDFNSRMGIDPGSACENDSQRC